MISKEDMEAVLARDGVLSSGERLRLRIDWFTQGKVIGGQEFVARHLNALQDAQQTRATGSATANTRATADARVGTDVTAADTDTVVKRANSRRPLAFSKNKNDVWSSLFALRGRK
jgi:hypothetical protein